MSLYWVLFIMSIILLIPFIIWGIKDNWMNIGEFIGIFIFGFASLIFLIIAIAQPISLKSKAIRQEKEREQIEYQIENLTEDSDKIKLNEWILTYNDWVNDVNTSKEVYGRFSWYWSFDMSNHTIIELV